MMGGLSAGAGTSNFLRADSTYVFSVLTAYRRDTPDLRQVQYEFRPIGPPRVKESGKAAYIRKPSRAR